MTGNGNNRGRSDTNFTNVTFDEIRESLITKARTYYPEAYKDFSATSFGGMMIDLISMVSEQLNFYTQFVANENFAETSRTSYALKTHAATSGTKIVNRMTSTSLISLFTYVPVDLTGTGADKRYKHRILAGAKMANAEGKTFTLVEDAVIDLAKENLIGTHFSEDGSKNTYLVYETKARAVSGEEKQVEIEIGSYEKFRRAEIKDDTVSEIISVKDANGNDYYEVANLSQNVIYKSISDRSEVDPLRPELLKPFPVPRRFVCEEEGGRCFLMFGFGSENNLQKTPVADPSSLSLKISGKKKHVPDIVFDPSRLLEGDGFGVSPQNTTLTVRYLSSTSENSNSAADTVKEIVSAELVFDDVTNLDTRKMDYIKNVANISCTNKEPFNGSLTFTTKKEIVETIRAAKGTQGRAVTAKDYAAAAYLMPSKFGSVKRVSLVRDDNDLRRNLNLYVISEDANQKLQVPSTALLQNVKTWINSIRMVTDSIDVFPAKIINLGLEFNVVASEKINKTTIMSEIREKIFEEINLAHPEVGQHFSIGEIERILNSMSQVSRVNSVKVLTKNTKKHSEIRYDIPGNLSPDGGLVYIPKDSIWEIKHSEDIIGQVQ